MTYQKDPADTVPDHADHLQNDVRTCEPSDTTLPQAGSPPVRGYVYFVRSADNAIKIGYSKNPPGRLAELQCSNPAELTLIGSFRGTRVDEQDLHTMFCHHRIRGEWFHDDEELLDFIDGKTGVAPKLPPPSLETRHAISQIIRTRAAYGASTPIGYRHSNLAQQIRHYEFAEGGQKEFLGRRIAVSLREIETLRASIVQ